MTNTIKTRILLKTDTTANWDKAANSFIPKEGEVCVYLDRFQLDDGSYVPGIKVGDGTSYINELEFIGDEYINKEEIDEILGQSGGGNTGLTNETVTLTMESIGSSINQGNLVYISSLNADGLPIYQSESLVLNKSIALKIIKNSCFFISNSSLIDDTFNYSGNDLIRLTETGANDTYQILNNVTLEYEERAPV